MTTATTACCAPLGSPTLSDAEAAATARLFKALADPHRVRIVNLLATSPDPVCACEFTGPLGLGQPTVSHHLKKLVAGRAAGTRAARHLGLLLARPRHPWPPGRRRRPPGSRPMTTQQTDPDTVREQVRARYAAAATEVAGGQDGCGCGQPADCGCGSGCCGATACRGARVRRPSCTPPPTATPLPGAAVLASLGCGKHRRRRTAGRRVACWTWVRAAGSTCCFRPPGRPERESVGVDMTPEMLAPPGRTRRGRGDERGVPQGPG